MATINNNSTSLEPIAVIGIAYKFAGDIYCANDLWYTLKESQDAGSATTIDRFDLKSFIGHMLNINNNGQFHQKLLRADAEPANIDPCHRSPILKFVDLVDGDGDSVEKMSGTKTSVHTGQFSTDHVIATTRMRPEHRIKILWTY
ncbi:unnamed protein product [Adineta steineri]|uniref:Uncharacterized protein n=1 Tax=Adineta steineri TaxID=433720 RepID=A0A820MXW9_9BILA|nr:unnamed protein product [Adineta steineri]